MSSEVFDAYQEEFDANCNEFRSYIESLRECGAQDFSKKNEITSNADASITKINNLLKEMEMEVRGYPSSQRLTCNQLLQSNKEKFANLKTEFNNAKFAWERSGLTNTKSGEDKKRMLDVKEK